MMANGCCSIDSSGRRALLRNTPPLTLEVNRRLPAWSRFSASRASTRDCRFSVEGVCTQASGGIVLATTAGMSTSLLKRLVPRVALRVALAATVVALLACGKDAAAPDNPQIAGHWKGDAAFSTVRFEATFTQTGSAVGGAGQFTSPLGSGPFTVAGQLTGADVALNLTSSEFGATTYVGRFSGPDRIIGHITASSYGDIDLTLDRD